MSLKMLEVTGTKKMKLIVNMISTEAVHTEDIGERKCTKCFEVGNRRCYTTYSKTRASNSFPLRAHHYRTDF